MAVAMSDDLASDREDVPVVLRLRQYRGETTPTQAKMNRTPSLHLTKFRMDHLMALSATPLIALAIYIGWQLTATPVAPASSTKPIAKEPPAIRIESIPEAISHEHSQGPLTPANPASEPSQSQGSGLFLPSSDASSFQPTRAARPLGETSEIRSAECWCNETAEQNRENQGADPNVIRIRSVEAVRPTSQMRGKMRPIPAAPE